MYVSGSESACFFPSISSSFLSQYIRNFFSRKKRCMCKGLISILPNNINNNNIEIIKNDKHILFFCRGGRGQRSHKSSNSTLSCRSFLMTISWLLVELEINRNLYLKAAALCVHVMQTMQAIKLEKHSIAIIIQFSTASVTVQFFFFNRKISSLYYDCNWSLKRCQRMQWEAGTDECRKKDSILRTQLGSHSIISRERKTTSGNDVDMTSTTILLF